MYKLLDKKEHRKILNRLPNYQHYYNKLNYNKVDYLYCYAVPFGKKCLAWFTLYKNKETCFFIELNNQKINKIYMKPTSFSKNLAYVNNNFKSTWVDWGKSDLFFCKLLLLMLSKLAPKLLNSVV